eukprot:34145_1
MSFSICTYILVALLMSNTEEYLEEQVPVIIDNGSHCIKAGFGGADYPQISFPSIVGKLTLQERDLLQSSFIRKLNLKQPVSSDVFSIIDQYQSQRRQNGYYVGEDTSICRTTSYPITDSIITNWNDIEHVWQYTLDELHVTSRETPVFMTEAPLNPRANREKMTQIVFETMETPKFYVGCTATLSIYAAGRTTALAILCGFNKSVAVPVIEGYVYGNPIRQQKIGGKQLTKHLHKLLNSEGMIDTAIPMEIVKDIKETLCFVETDDDGAKGSVSYTLPDGKQIEIERTILSQCANSMFEPALIGMEEELSLPQMIHYTIQARTVNMWHKIELSENMVLSGGNSLFTRLEHRLYAEMKNLTSLTVKLVAPPERLHSVWIGGSILSALSTFDQMWITKNEYDEEGPRIVSSKCV